MVGKVVENQHIDLIVQASLYSSEVCDAIIGRAQQQDWTPAQINDGEHEGAIRDTALCNLARTAGEVLGPVGLSQLQGCLAHYNPRCWKFFLDGSLELNMLRYVSGAHYNSWHMDVYPQASTRKLSFTVQLSDADAYAGGALEFIEHPEPVTRQQGSIILFPAFAAHRVTPVTEGVRYALVGWAHGPAFR